MADTPQQLLSLIHSWREVRQDQWQAQIQAQIQTLADVYVYSTHLTDEDIRRAMLRPCHSVEETVAMLLKRYGPEARICVLPEGPMTIPFAAS
jgi:nickel-dependent lactate racemase